LPPSARAAVIFAFDPGCCGYNSPAGEEHKDAEDYIPKFNMVKCVDQDHTHRKSYYTQSYPEFGRSYIVMTYPLMDGKDNDIHPYAKYDNPCKEQVTSVIDIRNIPVEKRHTDPIGDIEEER